MVDFSLENTYWLQGCGAVCGVDEAGRGPLAGPVCAAAVIFAPDTQIPGLDDSKKLTEKKREALFPVIQEKALAYGIGYANEREIDEYNILNATFLAMRRAVEQLSVSPDVLLIDGNQKPHIGVCDEVTVIKGDAKSVSIAAASVLAKVSRDHKMLELDVQYPQYAFRQHKGYGTKLHYERLSQYGLSPVHRRTFLKKFLEAERDG